MWILVSHGGAPVSDTGSGSARGAASSSLKLESDVQLQGHLLRGRACGVAGCTTMNTGQ